MSEPHFERSQEPDLSDEIPGLHDADRQSSRPIRNQAYWAARLIEAVRERDELALQAIANGGDLASDGNYNASLGRISMIQEEYEAYGAAEIISDISDL